MNKTQKNLFFFLDEAKTLIDLSFDAWSKHIQHKFDEFCFFKNESNIFFVSKNKHEGHFGWFLWYFVGVKKKSFDDLFCK